MQQSIASPPLRTDWLSVNEALPEPHELVLYRTEWYQFTGFINSFGDWFMAAGGREAHEVIKWRPLKT